MLAFAQDKDDSRIKLPLIGFEGIKRYWDKHQDIVSAKILPGEFYVTKNDEAIVTVLGSCVSACIRDSVKGVGGMNHFMLPATVDNSMWNNDALGVSTRYGNFAMEHLINEILKNGGERKNLEIKIFGGGRMFEQSNDIGRKNITFVHAFINMEKLKLIGEDTGDVYPRKVYYRPTTGKVMIKKLRNMHNDTIKQREQTYRNTLEEKATDGEIDLF